MRTKALAALAAAFLFALFCVNVGAQRNANNSASQPSKKSARTKRVIVGRGTDTAKGSRVTITSDDTLKDYSAYRSGDRFYVVLPKSSAGAVARGASGKGYSDMQVQQRGGDVVVSYRVAPGAKASISQKFNRLDVVFDVPGGGAQATAQTTNSNTSKPPTPTATDNKNQGTQNQTASQTTPPQSASANTGSEKRTAGNAEQAGAGTPNVTTPPVANAEQPTNTGQAAPEGSQPPVAEQTPAATPAVEQQVAQTQATDTIAPITTANPATSNGFSLGTFLLRNWALALVITLVVAGLGLIIAARRSSATSPLSLEESESEAALKEARAPRLKDASAATTLSAAEAETADVELAATAATLAAVPSAAEAKEKEKWDEELAIVEETKAETSAQAATPEASAVEASTEEASVIEASAEASALAEPVAEEAVAAEPSVEESRVEEVAAEEVTSEVEADTVEAVSTDAALPTTEIVSTNLASPTTGIVPASEAASSDVTGIAPVVMLDPDNVQAQARRVLEGEDYDRGVIGSSDSMARQMIAAELLSALSGRNFERRERARAAFVEHGYFDEKVCDLSEAEAPAERAAAARSLAIVGDRAATPYLIAALEDKSVDVRRAAVEALGELRDPAAVEPLESLLERERQQRIKIPPRIVRNAVESCRQAAREISAPTPASVEPVGEVAGVVAEETTLESAPVAEETAAIEPVVEERRVEEVSTEIAPAAFEEMAAVEDEPALVAEPQVSESAFAETEVAEPFVDETQTPEATFAEPSVAEETGLQPFEEAEMTAADYIEPSVSEVEPYARDAEVAEVSGDAAQVSLFDESGAVGHETDVVSKETEAYVADETGAVVARDASEVEETPVGVAAEPPVESGVVDAGDWIDFDVTAKPFGQSPGAVEPSESVFESSSGEALTADVVQSEAATTFEEEAASVVEEERGVEPALEQVEESFKPARVGGITPVVDVVSHAGDVEKGVAPFDEFSTVPASIQQRLASREPSERAAAINELSHVDSDEAFQQICSAFDDEAKEVRSAAARALYELRDDRAESFTRALREATSERRRQIGSAISASGLASEAISQLTGESREKTYEAFSLLFLMAKAGEVQPLIRAIEGHPNSEVRLAVVKLLALSGQKEILPAFRRLAVRGSLPTEVRSAVMEAIYQISSSQPSAA